MIEFNEYIIEMAKRGIDTDDNPLDEALTASQRMKRKQSMKKAKAKIKLGRKKAEKKLASKETLMKRARKHARDMIVKKLTKGKGKADLSFAQRQQIEKKVEKKKAAIERLAKKILPKIRKLDREKLASNKESDTE